MDTEGSTDPKEFDAIIVGTGQAGTPLAGRLTQAGMTVAVVERGRFGGTCVNTGCTPTKAMVASAYVARLAARAREFGVEIPRPAHVDLKAVRRRADGIVEGHRAGIERGLSQMDGCRVYRGHARFESSHVLRVGADRLTAPKIFLNVGGRAIIPDMPGIGEIDVMTNTEMVALDQLPRHLLVVGGSYIGLEFAQMYCRFGAQVTVIEKSDRLLPREDVHISAEIKLILEREGIRLRLGAECVEFVPHAMGAAALVACDEGDREIVASHVLLAVGRRPNTDDLGLEDAGVDTDPRGYIRGRRATAHKRRRDMGARRLQRARGFHPHRLQ